MTIQLDCRAMTDRTAAHDLLKESLNFPDYYGRNLDALYDLLTEIGTPTTIEVLCPSALKTHLGHYGESLLETLLQAAHINPALNIELSSQAV